MIDWSKININHLSRVEEVTIPFRIYNTGNRTIKVVYDWLAFKDYIMNDSQKSYYDLKSILFLCPIPLDNKYNVPLHFEECFFNEAVTLEGIFDVFTVRNCVFDKQLTFSNPTFNKNVIFDKNFNNDSIEIYSATSLSYFYLNTCGHYKSNHASDISIFGGNFNNLTIGAGNIAPSRIRNLTISSGGIVGSIYVVNKVTTVENLYLHNASKDLTLILEDFKINQLSILGFTNTGRFKISNVRALSNTAEFKICKSNLGKAEFLNVNLASFNAVNIIDSYLIDTIFVNTKWPEEITSYEQNGSVLAPIQFRNKRERWYKKVSSDEVNYFFKNRETYRQIKYAQGKQGDTVMEQQFHGKEMSAYVRYLNICKDFFTILIIHLSRLTSDFGQSISKPIFTLLTIHYWLFMYAIGLSAFEIQCANWKGDFLYKFFYLLNPVHVYNFKLNGVIIIDILMRINSSYMIYNFIRASRRFIK